ncbi:hypothetical protein DERF_001912 [Dermatophagoides farinae]|uniref:Uncharacterized protein n=1 Tax=Dermatophagoides farinae TaxID=6954 RepID=A0A922ID90_DERFA|nr:hypothetical protein DERF_001912 [Dermatophagoides farinae]
MYFVLYCRFEDILILLEIEYNVQSALTLYVIFITTIFCDLSYRLLPILLLLLLYNNSSSYLSISMAT